MMDPTKPTKNWKSQPNPTHGSTQPTNNSAVVNSSKRERRPHQKHDKQPYLRLRRRTGRNRCLWRRRLTSSSRQQRWRHRRLTSRAWWRCRGAWTTDSAAASCSTAPSSADDDSANLQHRRVVVVVPVLNRWLRMRILRVLRIRRLRKFSRNFDNVSEF